jgi:hypothetical protein
MVQDAVKKNRDSTGFSRVILNFNLANHQQSGSDTTGVVLQLQPTTDLKKSSTNGLSRIPGV